MASETVDPINWPLNPAHHRSVPPERHLHCKYLWILCPESNLNHSSYKVRTFAFAATHGIGLQCTRWMYWTILSQLRMFISITHCEFHLWSEQIINSIMCLSKLIWRYKEFAKFYFINLRKHTKIITKHAYMFQVLLSFITIMFVVEAEQMSKTVLIYP